LTGGTGNDGRHSGQWEEKDRHQGSVMLPAEDRANISSIAGGNLEGARALRL
jgi:hypothetical protein